MTYNGRGRVDGVTWFTDRVIYHIDHMKNSYPDNATGRCPQSRVHTLDIQGAGGEGGSSLPYIAIEKTILKERGGGQKWSKIA